jgi:ribosomal protein S18 acetylase RimI-like enzyme
VSETLVIRQGTEADYDWFIAQLDAWWGGRSMASMLPRLFFKHFPPWTYVADLHGEPIGFLCGFRSQSDPSVVYCHFIGVSPGARGRGVGERLYERLFVDALAAGCTEVHAVTSPQNQGSIAFHTRLGFSVIPGSCESGGLSWHPDYDGPGENRVRFKRALQNLNV